MEQKSSNIFYHIFTWMSGADTDILNTCSKAEQNKQVGIGSLILIPMTLSGISMGFAIFTISDNWWVSVILGCIWAVFILLIDRFLVTTFVKTANWKDDIKSTAVKIRLLFAFAVGFTVSHPLVLFIFDDTIQKNIVKYNFEEQNKLKEQGYEIIKNDKQRLKNLETKIDSLAELDRQWTKLINAEVLGLGGYHRIGSDSIRASTERNRSGVPHPNTDNYMGTREIVRGDKKSYDGEKTTLLSTITDYDLKTSRNIDSLKVKQKADFLTRATSLSRMWQDPDIGWTVAIIEIFLIFFFWFVDVLPIICKVVLAKYGDYDQRLEEKENLKRLEAKNQHDTDREKTLLKRYLEKYKYDMNRELGRIKLEHIFRFKKRKINNSIYKDFSSDDGLKKELDDTEM